MKQTTILLALLFPLLAKAQSATVSAGADASSASGSISYSVGQIAIGQAENSVGSINEGVQQPYEFFTIHIDEALQSLGISLFPNPTLSEVVIQLSSAEQPLKASFFALDGSLVEEVRLNALQTKVNVDRWAASTYLLKISDQRGNSGTYKLIKH